MNTSIGCGSGNTNTSRRPAEAPRTSLDIISGEQTLVHLKLKPRNPKEFPARPIQDGRLSGSDTGLGWLLGAN